LLFIVSIHQTADSALAADIAFRFVQRLSLASAERLERLFSKVVEPDTVNVLEAETERNALMGTQAEPATAVGSSTLELLPSASARLPMGWIRDVLGWSSSPVSPARSLGEE
jgi:UDP-GlcNAc:undecaprenyl-phosphate GlcNAc-1-phosphate transferase